MLFNRDFHTLFTIAATQCPPTPLCWHTCRGTACERRSIAELRPRRNARRSQHSLAGACGVLSFCPFRAHIVFSIRFQCHCIRVGWRHFVCRCHGNAQGGTKNGLMFGEAVVLLDTGGEWFGRASAAAKFVCKQAMQLPSKMRFIAGTRNVRCRLRSSAYILHCVYFCYTIVPAQNNRLPRSAI